jgi:hypothetical protein
MKAHPKVRLEAHQVSVEIRSHLPEVLEHASHDFAFFQVKNSQKKTPDLTVTVLSNKNAESFAWIPWLKFRDSTLYLPLLCERRVRLFGSVRIRYAYRKGYAYVYCDDSDLAYETVYLLVLSFLGEKLGEKGLQRLHGFGFQWQDQGVVLLARSGGGKSTLGLSLLETQRTKLISDDTPLIDLKGDMHAFPQRIALAAKPSVPEKFLRKFKRHHHPEKYVVGAEYFRQKVTSKAKVDWLIITKSKRAKKASLKKVSRWQAAWPIVKWLVIGYETPQIWQLFLRGSPRDFFSKTGILKSRMRQMQILLKQSSVASLTLSSQPKEAVHLLKNFLEARVPQ